MRYVVTTVLSSEAATASTYCLHVRSYHEAVQVHVHVQCALLLGHCVAHAFGVASTTTIGPSPTDGAQPEDQVQFLNGQTPEAEVHQP